MVRQELSRGPLRQLTRQYDMRNGMVRLLIVMSLLAVALNLTANAQGCSMCRTALEQSPEGRAMAESFDYAILFLMGIPYAMLGAAGVAIYRAYRLKKRDSAGASSD